LESAWVSDIVGYETLTPLAHDDIKTIIILLFPICYLCAIGILIWDTSSYDRAD